MILPGGEEEADWGSVLCLPRGGTEGGVWALG